MASVKVATIVPLIVALIAGTASTYRSASASTPIEATCPRKSSEPTPARSQPSSGSRPIVLVHGWNSGPGDLDAFARAVRQKFGKRATTYQFDYSAYRDNWAGDAVIAGCLAIFIDAVSREHAKRGGDGKVLLVGYSMGGLAIRYATGLKVGKTAVGERMAGVVTLDTPHKGSFWGGTVYSRNLARMTEMTDPKQLPLPPPDSDATKCLERREDGKDLPPNCGDLPPYLPKAVPIQQISGQVTVERVLLNVKVTRSFSLGGDSVVDIESERGYAGSGPGVTPPGQAIGVIPVPCTLSTFQLGNEVVEQLTDNQVDADVRAGRVSEAWAGLLFEANHVAPCSHLQIPSNSVAIKAALQALTRWMDELDQQRALLSSDGVGPFRIGMTKNEVQAVAGVPLIETGGEVCRASFHFVGRADFDDSPGFFFDLSTHRLIGIMIDQRTVFGTPVKTHRGIGFGSSVAAVKAAYGSAAEPPAYSTPFQDLLIVHGAGTSAMAFQFSGDSKIIGMRAGSASFVQLPEGCA